MKIAEAWERIAEVETSTEAKELLDILESDEEITDEEWEQIEPYLDDLRRDLEREEEQNDEYTYEDYLADLGDRKYQERKDAMIEM